MPGPNRFRLSRLSAFLLAGALLSGAGCAGDGTGSSPAEVVDGDSDTYRYRCDVSFRIEGPVATYEEVSVAANFASSLGTFLVDERGARCVSHLPGLAAAGEQEGLNNSPDNPDNRRQFFATFDDVNGLELPADVATCVFLARELPAADAFGVDTAVFQPVGSTEMPTYFNRPKASAIVECEDFSTLPDSTTTTLLDECAVVDCESGEACRGGDCVTLETGLLEIWLDSADDDVGALQLQIDYGDSGATFTHPSTARACTPNPDATSWLYAECDFREGGEPRCAVVPGFHVGELSIGIVTLEPIEAPLLLATCEIAAEHLEEAAAALRVEPMDLSNTNLEPTDGEISIRLSGE
jgi:hypothetical protein